MISIYIVDDHEIVIAGLVALLSRESDFDVVGHSSSADAARKDIPQARPNVVILEHALSDSQGLELCRELTDQHGASVVVHSAFLDDESARACVNAGAKALVSKDSESAVLRKAIRAAARSESYFDPALSPALTLHVEKPGAYMLSPAVRAVLKLAIEGRTNAEIADELGVTINTVKSQLATAYRRLGVQDRSQAAAAAMRMNLL